MADHRWKLSDHIDREATDLKERWIKTGDIKFAAMAIGRWPHDPPPWAMIACHKEHRDWFQRTPKGNSKDADGAVLDEIIRCYFRAEEEAQKQTEFTYSNYAPPEQKTMIEQALRNVEGRTPEEGDYYRGRFRAIKSRLDEELEDEGSPKKATDGAPMTARYHRMLQEWGEREVGAPEFLHSFELYLQRLAQEGGE